MRPPTRTAIRVRNTGPPADGQELRHVLRRAGGASSEFKKSPFWPLAGHRLPYMGGTEDSRIQFSAPLFANLSTRDAP